MTRGEIVREKFVIGFQWQRCFFTGLAFIAMGAGADATAQTRSTPPTISEDTPPPVPVVRQDSLPVGTTAPSAVGQRKTRELLAQEAAVKPMARINSRIQNRVQSRIRNRIDKYYDPLANSSTPFQVAADQVLENHQR